MYIGFRVKHPLFWSGFTAHWIGSINLKKTQISTVTKMRLVEAEIFHADERTDTYEKANNRFRNFPNVPKI
jgi:hypothetical protein